MGALYQAFDVWKRISKNRLVRYRCFKHLPSGKFSVQSADFYSVPPDIGCISEHGTQYLELLAEQAPDERSGAFNSIEEALESHEKTFGATSNEE